MKLVFASDSFKGTLSSGRIGELLEEAAAEVLPSARCATVPIADGGEGTLEAIRNAREGTDIPLYVHDGLRQPIRCKVFMSGDEGFVEAASTCGLALFSASERDPLMATSLGVGQCISHALAHGCRKIYVGLGGTCTNDGGMGCLKSLGVKFFDEYGAELPANGMSLKRVARIDESGLYPPAKEASFTILNDVDNPLLGEHGATHVFGRQKGADDEALDYLEAGMRQFADVIHETHTDVDFDTPGYGAAGGLGMALSVFLGAHMKSGVEALLEWTGFDSLIEDADLIVTGEGRLDGQSSRGKAVSGVVAHAKRAGVPVAAICGQVALDDDRLRDFGFAHVVDMSAGQSREYALAHAEENYRVAARELFGKLAK